MQSKISHASYFNRFIVVSGFVLFLLSVGSVAWAQERDAKIGSTFALRLASFESVEGWAEHKTKSDGKSIYVDKQVIIDDGDIESIKVVTENRSKAISVKLTSPAGKKLGKESADHLGKPVAIMIEGEVVTAPVVQSKIGRDLMITGDFSDAQIKQMLDVLQRPPKVPQFDKAKLDDLAKRLDRAHERKKFSGTVLIAVDGKIVFEKSVGFANVKEQTPFDQHSSFRLASVSKQFTAMGIMLLKEDGKLDLDSPITKFFPELPYEGVTIRHLLHHTGGIPDYMALFTKHWDRETDFDKRKVAFNRDMINLLAEHKPERLFAPGEKWDYSNTGYVLLASVIEKVSGQTIQAFMQNRIFDPLEMKDSRVFEVSIGVSKDFDLPSRVYGFMYVGDDHVDNDWNFLNGMVGDGGIYASARDLLKWDQALYTEKLVKKAMLDEAFTSGVLKNGIETGYGYGWIVSRDKTEGLTTSHDGSWVGFRTSIQRHPDRKLTVIVLSNSSTLQIDQINRAIEELE